jgi:hypothetical protein
VRFIIMHKTNARWEAGAKPDEALVARVGSMLGGLAKAGVLIAGEGLRPSSEGVRLRFAGGERTIVPGPFARGNELPAGFSILRASSLYEVIEWATRQAAITDDVEIDIRPVTEPWDIGLAQRPAEITTRRYMILRKATAATEAGESPLPAARAQLARLIDESTRIGAHVATETIRPSKLGRRCTNTKDGVSFFDGPFVETKELIAGYVIVDAASMDAASRLAARYIEAVGAEEVDVRELECATP